MPVTFILRPIRLFIRLITTFTLLVGVLTAPSTKAFSGSDTCKNCHASEYELWQGSHHDLAMQRPTDKTVLGNFNNTSFSYNGITTQFLRRGDKFIVKTDGETGELTEYEVAYVFGVSPLQQYLLPLSRGRLQALSIAWDARTKDQGGQRWYHLYPDEQIDYKDPLHWTGPYHNWNTRCAECHSTGVKKNYDPQTRSFNTRYEAIDVGCEACHGPGEAHLQLAKSGELSSSIHSGLPTDLAQRGAWATAAGSSIAARQTPLQSRAQVDSCGRCHSRRSSLGDYHYGADLLDTHRLALPQGPLYHYDGQILDEVFVYGSFIQSKMHQAGVVCSNCHEPHSLKLRATGNAVCSQCHKPATYDTPDHHQHRDESSGALCANCHMPETTYMGTDPRRDHSMRVPRPDLSLVIGTPNACNQCHTDRDPQWALDALRDQGVHFRDTSQHIARSLARLESGDTRVVPQLAKLANDPAIAPIWRATAIEALEGVGGRDTLQTIASILYDDDSIIRTSAVRSLQFLSLGQRLQLLTPLMDDPITSVRMEVASSLAAVSLDQVSDEQAQRLSALFQEYIAIHTLHADMPGTQLQLGLFYSSRGDTVAAEKSYREALHLNGQLLPAYLNLADLLRAQSRDDEARQLLLQALVVAPQNGNALHAIGLLETRSGSAEKALDFLGRAAKIERTGTRHRFVYAIALHDLGKPRDAITQLNTLLRIAPHSKEVLLALANYHAELGEQAKALSYARQLLKTAPTNQYYKQLVERLSRR